MGRREASMHKLTTLASLVLAAFVASGCGGSSPTTPTRLITVAEPALSVSPSTVVARSVDSSFCPAVPPFTVPFHLLIHGKDAGLVVTSITMRFVDSSGVQMPQVTLPAPVPTTQFGTALAESRDLPLSLGIGCGTGHAGTLFLLVETLDGQGRRGSTDLIVDVR
jgi:hypothetical protein